MPNGSIVVVGGGATCFSMGTFWNKGLYTLHIPDVGDEKLVRPPRSRLVHAKTVDIIPGEPSPPSHAEPRGGVGSPRITPIARLRLETHDDFLKVVREGRPVVLEGLDLGDCVSTWTIQYLVDKIGSDRKVRGPANEHRPVSVR